MTERQANYAWVDAIPTAVLAFAVGTLLVRSRPGAAGLERSPMVTNEQRLNRDETPWQWEKGSGRQDHPHFHLAAVDYGIKRNILRLRAGTGCKVTVVPAQTSAEDFLALKPDG